MKGTGYFAPETQAPSVDPDELDDHDIEAPDITIDGDGVGPMGPYFERLVEEAHRCFDLAKQARSRGYDPETEPEIPFAVDLASRVEALVGPDGVAQRIRDLSETMGREELALTVSKQVAAEEFCEYDSPEAALDGAIRTGLAILTEGILVAPLEGVAHVKVRANDDGTDYADIYFAGPIRAAGGTGQAMSVLIADVVRRELGLGSYNASRSEIERFKEEIPAYKKAANLQYTPSPDEIELIVANMPVGINGEGTEQEEVSGNRDLPRVETNALRGGACLVLAEGMTLKAPKILKHVDKLGLEGWAFLDDFVKAQKKDDDGGDEGGKAKGPKIKPNPKYVTELVAGRPVFGHPMAPGGFRLRYGRARTAGLASTAVHPAILHLVDDFLAVGTQMKVERPGKGTVATPCDTVEPPIVRLQDGTVLEVEGCEHALEIRDRVSSILDMGEMLVPFGEFLENNKPLAQAAWCPEWWRLVVEDAGHEPPNLTDMQAARAFAFAEETGTPLHPRFTLLWHDLTTSEIAELAQAVAQGSLEAGRLALPRQGNLKDLLERLGACHDVETTEDGDRLLLDHRCSMPIVRGAGYVATTDGLEEVRTPDRDLDDPLQLAAQLSGVALEPKAPCRIGARMGRPEKAAERAMSPPVHTLFPLGNAGGLQRLVKQAKQQGTIGTSSEDRGQRHRQVEVGTRHCPQCGTETLSLACKSCQITTEIKGSRAKSRVVQIGELVEEGVERLQLPKLPDGTKGVQGLMSESRIPEPIEKGMLRAHHDISVFKDGTCRYDMTDLPLTHFRPREIGTPVETLRELGYTHDIHGDELTSPDQLLELAPQDIVVNQGCLGYMARVAEFTDDLLTRFYGLKPYYELDTPEDLIGHLAVGLAPHTSGGVLCRIIGTTRAQGHWGHPYFHAAKRRNCFHGDTELLVYEDGQARKVQLRDLVAPRIEAGGRPLDDHGTQVADAPANLEVLSLDPETGFPTRRPVTKLIQGTTERWIEIETTTHRSITVTPDHDVLVHRDGQLTTVKAAEVRQGDEVPVGTSLPREPAMPTVNLPAELADHPEADRFRLREIDAWLRDLVEGIGRARAAGICQADDDLVKTPSRWYASFPVGHYAALVEAGLAAWDDLPDDAGLGVAHDHVTLPVRIPVTPGLCRLLGLYLAEGHARSTASAHQISWRASEPELSGKIVDLVDRVFGIEPSVGEDGTKVTVCSKLSYLLFTHVWETGEGAETKRVPGWCYDLPEEHITELLGGFFDGDGSVVHDPPRLRFYSKNRRLLEDVSTLLQAVGLFARFVPGKPRPPGSFLAERYRSLDKPVPESLDPVHALNLTGLDVKAFAAMIHADHPVKRDRLGALSLSDLEGRNLQGAGTRGPAEERAHHLYDRVLSVEEAQADDEATYCIDIETGSDELSTKNVLLGDGLYQVRCDGDEDCVMLLLDGLLNFSRTYLPRTRGGQMDAPLTLSTRIDPQEIDKEAHNIDALFDYPLAFFEATRGNPSPKDAEDLLELVADRLGGDRQYTEIGFTHDTATIDEGPELSAYKTIGSMLEKMDGQLGLGRKIRAVDEADVASRVICDHFLPDIIGNLKAFSRQTVRCAKCNMKFRRVPLQNQGRCPKCKNTLTMTVHEASVKKYVKVAKKVAAEYNVDAYTLERLNLAQDAIESLFENDKVKKATLADFL